MIQLIMMRRTGGRILSYLQNQSVIKYGSFSSELLASSPAAVLYTSQPMVFHFNSIGTLLSTTIILTFMSTL